MGMESQLVPRIPEEIFHLGIEENETTADFQFTFETVACLGACALSPVLLVNKIYYGKLTPAKVEQILKQYP